MSLQGCMEIPSNVPTSGVKEEHRSLETNIETKVSKTNIPDVELSGNNDSMGAYWILPKCAYAWS